MVEGVEYFRIDVEDMSREPIDMFFEEGSDFISDSLENNEGVLVTVVQVSLAHQQ